MRNPDSCHENPVILTKTPVCDLNHSSKTGPSTLQPSNRRPQCFLFYCIRHYILKALNEPLMGLLSGMTFTEEMLSWKPISTMPFYLGKPQICWLQFHRCGCLEEGTTGTCSSHERCSSQPVRNREVLNGWYNWLKVVLLCFLPFWILVSV